MAFIKVNGFHTGPSGPGVPDAFFQALDAAGIPAMAKSSDGSGGIMAVQQLIQSGSEVPHVAVWRKSDDVPNVPNYDLPAAESAAQHWQAIRPTIPPEFDPTIVWLEVVNEPRKELAWADWMGHFLSEIGALMTTDGYKLCGPGYSTGTPEYGAWETDGMRRYLELCAAHPDQYAIALHEYSLKADDIAYNWGDHIGRFRYLLASCDKMGIAHPRIFITEWGWGDRGNGVPGSVERMLEDILVTAELYAQYPAVECAAIWCLNGKWQGIAQKIEPLIESLQETILTTVLPGGDGDPPPPPPPPPEPEVIVRDFSEDWKTLTDRIQKPGLFEIGWKERGEPLWYDPDKTVSGTVEAKHLICGEQLAPRQCADGSDPLIRVGDRTFKIQAVGMRSSTFLRTVFEGSGQMQVRVPVNAHYQPTDTYDRVPSLERDDVYVVLLLNGQEVARLQFPELPDREWVILEGEALAPVTAELRFETHYENNRDVFTDGWIATTSAVPPPPPPPPPPPEEEDCPGQARVPYTRVYWVVPQDVTEEEYLAVCTQAFEKRRTVGFSSDDAGIGHGLASKTAVEHGRSDAEKPAYREWYAEHYPDALVKFRPLPGEEASTFRFTHWPTGYKYITQHFGANPENYAKFGLPGHEGIDIRAPHGTPVYVVADGTVYRVEKYEKDGEPYGIQVRVEHPGGYRTVYAHLLDASVSVGDVVEGGMLLGHADNTGNSFGDHLHLTLKSERAYKGGPDYIGYPSNIIDPTPFLTPLLDDEPPPADYTYQGPAVAYRPVIHGPASDWMWNMPEVQSLLTRLDMPVKYLSNGINPDHFDPDPWHLVRAFWQPDRAKTPGEAWNDIGGDLQRMYARGARRFELFNEPNLSSEGLGMVWTNGVEFGGWLRSFIDIMRGVLPEAHIYYPGLSPGVPWTNQFAFTNEAWPQVRELCDGFCMHAYTGETVNRETAVSEIVNQVQELQQYLRLQVPLVISEMSVNRMSSDGFRADVYREVDRRLAQIPGVEAGVWFISHWDPVMDKNSERWLGTRIPELYLGQS